MKLTKLYETKAHACVAWESKQLLSKHCFIEASVYDGSVYHLLYGIVKSVAINGYVRS